MDKILIVGDGGHGHSILDCVLATNNYDEIAFLIDHPIIDKIPNIKYYEEATCDINNLRRHYKNIIVAIGDNHFRLERMKYFKDKGFNLITLIHPCAIISPLAEIEEGSVILANTSINAFSHIGKGCIINTKVNVDHDTILEDGVHLSPGVSMGGYVHIGAETWVGVGSSIRNGIKIGENTIIGMGSVVVNDIKDNIISYGNPCKEKGSNNYESNE